MVELGVKGGRRVRLTTLPSPVSRLSRENVGASTSHNPMGLHDLLQGQLYLTSIPPHILHGVELNQLSTGATSASFTFSVL
jgi:hypothetical protein